MFLSYSEHTFFWSISFEEITNCVLNYTNSEFVNIVYYEKQLHF